VLLLGGAIVLVGSNYSYSDIIANASKISIPTLGFIFVALLASAFAAALRFKFVASRNNHRVTLSQAAAAVGVGSLAGALFFQIAGQLIGRGFLMARKGVPFASVVAITAYERIVAAGFSALLALAGAYFVFGNVSLDQNAGGGALIKIVVGLIIATSAGAGLGYGRLAARSVAPWLTLNFVKGFLQLVTLTALVQFLMMLGYVLVTHQLSPQTPIPSLIAASAIVMFAASVPISLAGWGVREMSAILALGAIGVAPQAAFLSAVIIGLGSMLAMSLLAGLFVSTCINAGPKIENTPNIASIDYSSVLTWVVPIGAATLVFFQIYVPIGSGNLLNVNLADPLAILGGALFVLMCVHERQLPTWRYSKVNFVLVAMTAVLTVALFIGASRFGWTRWAVVNRYWGWFILLAYAASGALFIKGFGREALRALLLTFGAVGASIAALELILLLLHNLGLHFLLPISPRELEAFSLNHNFFGFQMLMSLPAVLVAAQGKKLRVILTAVILAALYFSGSRSAWITTPIILAAGLYMNATTMRELAKSAIYLLGIVVLIVSAIAFANLHAQGSFLSPHRAAAKGGAVKANIQNSFLSVRDTLPEITVLRSDNEMRMTSIIGGVHLFLQHPFIGAGLGAFRNKLIIFKGHEPLLIHSTSLWLLAELGPLGLLAFGVPALYLLFGELRRGSRADPGGQIIALCLLAFGVMSLPADMLYQRTFWLLIGAALMVKPDFVGRAGSWQMN